MFVDGVGGIIVGEYVGFFVFLLVFYVGFVFGGSDVSFYFGVLFVGG